MTELPITKSPAAVTENDLYDTDYHPSMKWDYARGDFVRDGNYNMVKTDGYDALQTWCVKAVMTERYACFAYPDEIGAEIDAALGQENHAAVQAMLRRTITDAILVNPRVVDVRNFVFDWQGSDTVHVAFEVIPTRNEPFTISV